MLLKRITEHHDSKHNLHLLVAFAIDIQGYVDGISLTHGSSPRSHIWTFAVAWDETRSDYSVCPCTKTDTTYRGVIPPFLEMDYFCATGSHYVSTAQWYTATHHTSSTGGWS